MKTLRRVLLLVLCSSGLARAAGPVVRLDFGEKDVLRAVAVGAMQRPVPGPRPPEYPGFEGDNLAVLPGRHQLPLGLRIRAGLPATVAPSGTSFVTTDPAPTTAPRPIVRPGSTTAPAPTE